MAYNINLTNGSVLTSVADGTLDTNSTDLRLVGKNYTGYGEFLNENFIWMLENFANNVAPTAPLSGQLWWNTDTNTLLVYDGTRFKSVSAAEASVTPPTNAAEGDMWWDTANGQLHTFNGTQWVLIGPAFTAGSGTSGAVVEVVTDTNAVDHVVVKTYVADTVVSITSKDQSFTPQTAIPGFTTIEPGINMASNVVIPNIKVLGTATDADALGGVAATDYMRTDVDSTTAGTIAIANDGGLVVGPSNTFQVSITGISETAELFNRTTNADLVIGTTDNAGTPRPGLTFVGLSGEISANNNIITNLGTPVNNTDAATKAYVDAVAGGSTGPGSGLDADLLDGQHGLYYLDWNNFTNVPTAFTPDQEAVEDIVGGMVTGNTESGIVVTYDDAAGKLNFDVADPVITLTGDVSGSATMTNLGNVTITTTVANDSHTHDTRYLQLTAKAADSELLDGIDSTGFLRSNAADIKTAGNLTFNDNIYLNFGSGNDVEFFFNGVNMYTDINAGAIWYVRDGNSSNAVRFTYDIDTGVGTATGDWAVSSDARLKDIQGPITNALEKVSKINGVRYIRTDLPNDDIHVGVIAQEVQEVLPEVVHTDNNGMLSVAYGNMVALLIEAVKELKAEVEELKRNK